MITEAVMADLVPKGLDRATDVVIAGASAGGLAVFLQVLQSHNCSIMGI
jgi:prolyl oligopeptidase PreP (S9A serine peptidase family)